MGQQVDKVIVVLLKPCCGVESCSDSAHKMILLCFFIGDVGFLITPILYPPEGLLSINETIKIHKKQRLKLCKKTKNQIEVNC